MTLKIIGLLLLSLSNFTFSNTLKEQNIQNNCDIERAKDYFKQTCSNNRSHVKEKLYLVKKLGNYGEQTNSNWKEAIKYIQDAGEFYYIGLNDPICDSPETREILKEAKPYFELNATKKALINNFSQGMNTNE